MILRQNIHVNVALVARGEGTTTSLFISSRLLKFLCVFCLSCVVYI